MLQTSIKDLNELRREAVQELENKILQSFVREFKGTYKQLKNNIIQKVDTPKVSVCLNNIVPNMEYQKIKKVDNIYIPLRFFVNSKLKPQIKTITENFNTYLLMPTISKSNYEKINAMEFIKEYNLKGVVVSNLSQIKDFQGIPMIANYTFNIANNYSINELEQLGVQKYTASPEFEREVISTICGNIPKEVIVYGRTLLMTTEYCAIGTFKNCPALCEERYI